MKNVTKTFPQAGNGGRRSVLEHFELNIPAGQSVAILGPSGCGKTTVLRLIAGLDMPDNDSAHILVDGRTVDGPGPDRGIVFQQYSSFPWLTAEENVLLAFRQRGLGKQEAISQARAYLALVDLEGHCTSFPAQLSGGQQQRLALARTLAAQPSVLLLDEPYAALDAQNRERMQSELLRMCQDLQPTVVFVTHDIREALRVGDRVLLMSRSPASIILETETLSVRHGSVCARSSMEHFPGMMVASANGCNRHMSLRCRLRAALA